VKCKQKYHHHEIVCKEKGSRKFVKIKVCPKFYNKFLFPGTNPIQITIQDSKLKHGGTHTKD
jgi:hypothetical protein